MKKPNILLFMADDHRGQSIGSLGETSLHTPTMDRLIAEGTAFLRNGHTGSFNVAVCVPARAALHTGNPVYRASRERDFRDASVPDTRTIHPERITLGEFLREVGYQTFFTGKWHNDTDSLNRSFGDGRRIFLGGMSGHYSVLLRDYDASGAYKDEDTYVIPRHDSELYTEAAIDFLNSRDEKSPFFLTVAFTSPHDPREAPEEFVEKYPATGIQMPPNFQQHPFDQGHRDIRDEKLADFPRDEDEIRRHIGDYFAMIEHQDREMGKVLQALEDRGDLENTIVVYTADHGLAVGQHGLMGKQNLYEHSVRVPLIFRGPGVPQAQVVEGLTQTPDLYPTLCEMTGIPIPETVSAKSLLPLMRNPKAKVRDYQYCLYFNLQRSVSDGRYKLIRYYRQGGDHTGLSQGEDHIQLFDLHQDPWETRNLYGVAEYEAEEQRLVDALQDWMLEEDDMMKDVPVRLEASLAEESGR